MDQWRNQPARRGRRDGRGLLMQLDLAGHQPRVRVLGLTPDTLARYRELLGPSELKALMAMAFRRHTWSTASVAFCATGTLRGCVL